MTISYWDEWCTGAVNLADYCNIVGFWECAFFGVNNEADRDAGCRNIWTCQQRKMVARYLCEAQEEIENELNFALIPSWYVEEEQIYRLPMVTTWGKVISGGVRATEDIALTEAVDLTADPSVVGPVATTVTDIDEIKIYYPGTDFEIIPSAITIAGGNVTIEIPRCRMVAYDELETPVMGLDYDNDANFQDEVDLIRVYNDESIQSELVDPHNCGSLCASGNCSEYTHTGCIYVRKKHEGIIDALPATYSDGVWTAGSCTQRYSSVRLNYYAGLDPITKQLQDATVRLAHSKMPQDPCGCDPVKYLWDRDRNVPEVMSMEQLNCPFGSSDGAWWAFKQATSVKLVKMGIF